MNLSACVDVGILPPHHNYRLTPNLDLIVIIAVFFSVIAAFTAFANIVIIISVVRSRIRDHYGSDNLQTRKAIAKNLMTSMAMSDAILGSFIMPMAIYELISFGQWSLGRGLCVLRQCLDVLLCTVSVYHVVCMAVDRYLAVCRPMLYRTLSSKSSYILILLCWTLPAIFTFLPILQGWHNQGMETVADCLMLDHVCANIFSKTFQVVAVTISFYVPLSVIFLAYILVLLEIRKFKERFRQSNNPTISKLGSKFRTSLVDRSDKSSLVNKREINGQDNPAFSLEFLPPDSSPGPRSQLNTNNLDSSARCEKYQHSSNTYLTASTNQRKNTQSKLDRTIANKSSIFHIPTFRQGFPSRTLHLPSETFPRSHNEDSDILSGQVGRYNLVLPQEFLPSDLPVVQEHSQEFTFGRTSTNVSKSSHLQLRAQTQMAGHSMPELTVETAQFVNHGFEPQMVATEQCDKKHPSQNFPRVINQNHEENSPFTEESHKLHHTHSGTQFVNEGFERDSDVVEEAQQTTSPASQVGTSSSHPASADSAIVVSETDMDLQIQPQPEERKVNRELGLSQVSSREYAEQHFSNDDKEEGQSCMNLFSNIATTVDKAESEINTNLCQYNPHRPDTDRNVRENTQSDNKPKGEAPSASALQTDTKDLSESATSLGGKTPSCSLFFKESLLGTSSLGELSSTVSAVADTALASSSLPRPSRTASTSTLKPVSSIKSSTSITSSQRSYCSTSTLPARRHSQFQPRQRVSKANSNSAKSKMNSHKAVKIIGGIVICFTICWLPFSIYVVVDTYLGYTLPSWAFFIVLWLGYINSALNPILYCGNASIKEAVRDFVCGSKRGKRSSIANRWSRSSTSSGTDQSHNACITSNPRD